MRGSEEEKSDGDLVVHENTDTHLLTLRQKVKHGGREEWSNALKSPVRPATGKKHVANQEYFSPFKKMVLRRLRHKYKNYIQQISITVYSVRSINKAFKPEFLK